MSQVEHYWKPPQSRGRQLSRIRKTRVIPTTDRHTMLFHPPDAAVPGTVRSDRLLLRPLRATDVALDYDAVMASREQLRCWSQTAWPQDDFTLEQNLADLERHEREHREGVAFTFTVLDPGATRCLGCVYLTPPRAQTAGLLGPALHPAEIGFWVRTSEVAGELDRHLLATLREWLAAEWRFDRVLFTIAAGETRQARLLQDAGLAELGAVVLADGRRCRVFA